ncbi:ATP-binding protein [Candidatus Babeliales bacterium]|nr:ATP-binding protein [Candidatus Babeliales bacterium]MBP9843980.1 ATP-binding protein [Candidatus Babeliales bacterium]
MNKKYFYVVLMLVVINFINAEGKSYSVKPEIYDEFYSDQFTQEQRKQMLDWLEKKGLLANASSQGMIDALNKADISALAGQASRAFFRTMDSKDYPEAFAREFVQALKRADFPEAFAKELVQAVKRGDLPQDFAQQLINGIEHSNLPKNFGAGLADGLIDGVNKNLKDNKVAEDLSKNGAKFVEEAFGKDSELYKKFKNITDDFVDIANNSYNSAILWNYMKTGVVTVGIAAALYSVPAAIRAVERNMKRPKLIIESSQLTMAEKIHQLCFGAEKKKPMEAMVFNPVLKKYLDDIVKIVSKSHAKITAGKTNVKYRNLMLFGPPGTGKTMFAKELARCSGLEFAYMSGSSFSKFQEGEAIEALDELFAWAKQCNGLMIFIDEAETFLSKRENMDPQSKAYQLLNNFLNYTGQRSSNFMIVFATNHKDVLDSAMYRRIDDLVEMPLPCKQQRVDTLMLYKNKILMDSKQNEKSLTDSVAHVMNFQCIERIAQETKGLSYGELEGIINNIKTEADLLDNPVVTVNLVNLIVHRVVKKHQDFTGGKHLGFIED